MIKPWCDCPKCRGTGMADSGGVEPWGWPIEIPCDCIYEEDPEEYEPEDEECD